MASEVIKSERGHEIAFRRNPGTGDLPGFVWLSGFNSDMSGTKAQALEAWAMDTGHPFLAFDYFGHGKSSGAFADGTVSTWKADAVEAIDRLTDGKQILVGSSMGGWMALLAALARPERVAGLILIAPAPDFTKRLMWDNFPDHVRNEILETGRWMRPSPYEDGPYPITRALIEDGRNHLLLDSPIAVSAPVRILQGMRDEDVPWSHAMSLVDALTTEDLAITLIRDGDHRLSRPQDISRLLRTAAGLSVDLGTET